MRLALATAVAESSGEARLLKQHGYTIRVATAAADITLPGGGGSLAFMLHSGGAPNAQLAERAARASKASRRCTVLWVRPSPGTPTAEAAEALQALCPPAVAVVVCASSEEAVEHMLACAERMATRSSGPSAADEAQQRRAAAQAASAHLASLFSADVHACDFMMASTTLSALARVTSEEAWERVVRETEGLVDADLLFAAVDWMQRDQVQTF